MRLKTVLCLFAALLLTFQISFGQSFFKPIPKVKAPTVSLFSRVMGASLTPADSTINAIRPTAAISAYAEPGNILMAGVGIAYQHLKYDYTNVRWQSQWSVGIYGFAGGSVAPQTPSDLISVGILAGFYNDLIRVGPIYNMNGKFGAAISIGINFTN